MYFDGRLSFHADAITLPYDLEPLGNQRMAVRPFTMDGRLLAYLDATRTGTPLFDYSVVGSGLVDVILNVDNGAFRTDAFSYRFAQTATTPEPASLLLMGSGLGFLIEKRRRARRAN